MFPSAKINRMHLELTIIGVSFLRQTMFLYNFFPQIGKFYLGQNSPSETLNPLCAREQRLWGEVVSFTRQIIHLGEKTCTLSSW